MQGRYSLGGGYRGPAKDRMSNASTSLDALSLAVRRFCEERDWDQFHGPKDLAIGLATEAAELLERFRFLSDEDCVRSFDDPVKRERIEDEAADVLFFLLRLADRFNIDLVAVFERKMGKNAERYPVDKARGSNRKYSDL